MGEEEGLVEAGEELEKLDEELAVIWSRGGEWDSSSMSVLVDGEAIISSWGRIWPRCAVVIGGVVPDVLCCTMPSDACSICNS